MTRYMRRPPRTGETVASAVVSLAIGMVAAAASFYLARILLARDRLDEPARRAGEAGGRDHVGLGRSVPETLEGSLRSEGVRGRR
jgi:hypothetical protein